MKDYHRFGLFGLLVINGFMTLAILVPFYRSIGADPAPLVYIWLGVTMFFGAAILYTGRKDNRPNE